MVRRHVLIAIALALSGCGGLPTPGQRLDEAAFDMNNAARFGRMDIALGHVSAAHRADYSRRHAAWGGKIRVVDLDFAGVNFVKKDEAEVFVVVSWQRVDESTMRTTQVAQRWKDDRGWQIAAESRRGGDYGLFGDAAPKAKSTSDPAESPDASPQADARFRTRVITEEP